MNTMLEFSVQFSRVACREAGEQVMVMVGNVQGAVSTISHVPQSRPTLVPVTPAMGQPHPLAHGCLACIPGVLSGSPLPPSDPRPQVRQDHHVTDCGPRTCRVSCGSFPDTTKPNIKPDLRKNRRKPLLNPNRKITTKRKGIQQ